MTEELERYKQQVREKLAVLTPIFAKACLGDCSSKIEIPEGEEEEFSELYVGIQMILDILEKQVTNLQGSNQFLENAIKEKTAELNRQLDLSKTLLKAQSDLGEGLVLFDEESQRLLYVNPAFAKMTGHDLVELFEGPSFLSLLDSQDHKDIQSQLEFQKTHGEASAFVQTRLLPKNGPPMDVDIVLKRLILEGGNKILGLVRDISERKRAEKEELHRVREQAARTLAETEQERAVFMAEASSLIFSSLDYQSTPSTIARLAVLRLADWCAVYLAGQDGTLNRVEMAHANPAKEVLVNLLRRSVPEEHQEEHPVMKAFRTGQSELSSETSPEVMNLMAPEPAQRKAIDELGLHSHMVVPIQSRGRKLGVLFFALGDSEHRFEVKDLELAEELALRAGIALDNAHLYSETLAAKNAMQALAAIVESTEEAIIGKTLGGIITNWNKGAEHVYGYRAEEVIGRHVSMLAPPDKEDEVITILARLKNGEAIQNLETQRRRKDGSLISVSLMISPIRDSDGNLIGASTIARDMTDRNLYEEELKAARDAAVESARIKSEFVANVSHEIRTPMNAIIGMTGLLLNGRLSPQQKDLLETVRNAGDALLTIINDILDFSKIEAGKMRIEMEDFGLAALVQSTIDFLTPRATGKGIALAASMDSNLPGTLSGDPGRIRQVLINLVGNAVKFTEKGEVRVLAHVEQETDKQATILFKVTDTGVGIPAEKQGYLFKPFSQADNSVTRKFGGSGLGLAISKHFVELMGGEMGFESASGTGSTFWFRIKFDKQRDSRTMAENRNGSSVIPTTNGHAHAKPAALAKGRRRHGRVLIVEDNSVNQKVVLLQLKQLGYPADAVGNGMEALEALRKIPYDVILMDCQMPEMDGYTATGEIRRRESPGARLPIIAMTAHAMSGDRQKCLQAGMDDYISKPVRTEDLGSVLARWNNVGEGSDLPAEIKFRGLQLPAGLEDPALVREITTMFLKNVPEYLAAIHAAYEKRDTKALRIAAHTLKGTCANVGVKGLSELCRRIELTAESGRLPGRNWLEELENQFEKVRRFLTKKTQGRKKHGNPHR